MFKSDRSQPMPLLDVNKSPLRENRLEVFLFHDLGEQLTN
jgi:hypothetical protein